MIMPKFKFPKIKVPKVTKKEMSMPSLKTIAKGTAAVATVGTVGYLGYQGARTGGEIIQSFSPKTKKEAAADPNLTPPTGTSPNEWADFLNKIGYNPNAAVEEGSGFWDRLGEGVGDVPESIGKNMIPLAVIAGIIIIGTQTGRKHGKK